MKWTKQSVYEDLKKKIVLQDLKPGQSLNEKELMESYGIGRTPLREVLLKLQSVRFVQMFPNRGTFVSPVDINEFKSVMEMRGPLEILAINLVIQRITEKEIEELESILSHIDSSEPNHVDIYKQLMLYESEFHNIIYKATRNEILTETLQLLQTITVRFWMYITKGGEELSNPFSEQRRLLETIKKKDVSSAIEIIKNHTNRTSNLLMLSPM